MKKIFVSIVALSLLLVSTPVYAVDYPSAAPFVSTDEGGDAFVGNQDQAATIEQTNTAARINELIDKGETVGCSSAGEFGGSMSNALGNAYQNLLQQLIGKGIGMANSKVQELLGSIASKAGPLAPIVNMVTGKVQAEIQKTLQSLGDQILGSFGGSSVMTSPVGVAAQAFGADVLGASNPVAAAVTGGVGAGASVPVSEIGKQYDETVKIREYSTKIEKHSEIIQQMQKLFGYITCVANPAIAKDKNAILAHATKEGVEYMATGCNGGPCWVQDIRADIAKGQEVGVKDLIEQRTAGMCAEFKQDVQQIVLEQHTRNNDFGVQSQCTKTGEKPDKREDPVGSFNATFADMLNLNNDSGFQFLNALSEINNLESEIAAKSVIDYTAFGGWYPKTECNDANEPPPKGFCLNGEKISIPGTMHEAMAAHTLTVPTDQLVQADEIGELIDSMSQGLMQFIFQNIDGLLGATEDQGEGSYLDQMVGEAYGGSDDEIQTTLLDDIAGALEVEEAYYDLIELVRLDLTLARDTYSEVRTCYAKYTTTGTANISTTLAVDTISLASTTLAGIVPQLSDITVLRDDSRTSINELTSLLERAQAALTTEELVAVSNDFSALRASGVMHNATDLDYLETSIEASIETIETLLKDSQIKLTVCKAG